MGAGHSPESPAGPGAQRQRGRASEQKPSEGRRAPLAAAARSRSVFSNPRVLTRPRLLPPPGNQGPSPAAPRSRDHDPQPRAAREAGGAAAGPAPGGGGRRRKPPRPGSGGWRALDPSSELSAGSGPELLGSAWGCRPGYGWLMAAFLPTPDHGSSDLKAHSQKNTYKLN